ncbi:EI24 domain-containing protein [Streptomyces verrucosisporus]|uniref:EI24 domain-containing protein n=1 Tax=Streptomyces verrucosisporus TaxID=1695161 RepID=UPI0019D18E49|nr:EI24 domain-containing protein [Streptomyces verrucosisporus]MBN3928491.1 EI24 domain-containing protein [Streptomyces verrucosisporus]
MSDLMTGARYLWQGQKWVLRNGRWFGFGLLPALITLVLYAAALIVLGFWADDLAAWATPFADDWSSPWAGLLRGTFTVLLFAGGLLMAVLTFTAVTLLIGDPFYESLSEKVEESEGGCPEGPDVSLLRGLWISLRDSLYVLVRALAFGVVLFLLGFVPVAGQTVVPVLGLLVSGFFLTLELTSVAMQRRDIPVRERLRMLRGRKALAVGFGAPLALCFLVPLVAVLLMPGAVAGAALLVRDLTDAPADGQPAAGEPRGPHGPQGMWAEPGHQGGPAGPAGPA